MSAIDGIVPSLQGKQTVPLAYLREGQEYDTNHWTVDPDEILAFHSTASKWDRYEIRHMERTPTGLKFLVHSPYLIQLMDVEPQADSTWRYQLWEVELSPDEVDANTQGLSQLAVVIAGLVNTPDETGVILPHASTGGVLSTFLSRPIPAAVLYRFSEIPLFRAIKHGQQAALAVGR